MLQAEQRRATPLIAVLALAAVYGALVLGLGTITGTARGDGIVGLVVGLYVCSHPAANAVDVLFFSRGRRQPWSTWPAVRWLFLNVLAVAAGWLVIVSGAIRLAQ
jgi:hypothetical protein